MYTVNMGNVNSLPRLDPIVMSWYLKGVETRLIGIENTPWSLDTGGGDWMKRILNSDELDLGL